MGSMESDCDDRNIHPGHRYVAVCDQPDLFLLEGPRGGERSLGRMDSRMVGEFTAAALQLRVHSHGRQPPSAVGPEAPGRSGLEIRIGGRTHLSSAPFARSSLEPEWILPSRARVGMISLISAESPIFTLFVVPSIFYIGESLSCPLPKES